MWEVDDVYDDVGCSANDRRWKSLVRLTEVLSEGKIELDQLVGEIEENKSENAAAANDLLDPDSVSKRNNYVFAIPANDEVKTTGTTGKKSGLRITFKINRPKVSDDRTQEPVSWEISIKKSSGEVPKTSRNHISKGQKRRRCFEDEEGRASGKKAKKRTEITNINVQELGPVLPERFKNHILDSGGCLESLDLVIEKDLYQTDVSTSHGRLSIPYGKIKNPFLISTELDEMDSTSDGIPVNLVQPCLKECQMSLRNWKSNSMYALVADWNEVCRENDLRQGTAIQLWSFRRDSALCLALVRIG